METTERPLASLEANLALSGLLVLATFETARLNEAAPMDAMLPENVGGRFASGVLLGSTKGIWSPFLREADLDAKDPLDRFVAERTHNALTREYGEGNYFVRFSHEIEPVPYPMQHLAEFCGIHRGPFGLNIHPDFGPWFSLRAVLVVPRDIAPSGPTRRPCVGCEEPCRRPYPSDSVAGLAVPLRLPLGAREACPVGLEHRYSLAQLSYHYTKNNQYLSPLPRRLAPPASKS